MKFIYIDESGDFGFGKNSTKSVIIAAVFTQSQKDISIWLKRIKRRKLPKKLIKLNELKASGSQKEFLDYFYRHANSDLKFSIYAVTIDKSKIPDALTHEEGVIYLKAIEDLVEIASHEFDSTMLWYFDRRSLKKTSWDAVAQIIKERVLFTAPELKKTIEVHPVESYRNLNIQFADFIAYAIGRFLNNKDDTWYKIIKPHIKKIKELNLKSRRHN